MNSPVNLQNRRSANEPEQKPPSVANEPPPPPPPSFRVSTWDICRSVSPLQWVLVFSESSQHHEEWTGSETTTGCQRGGTTTTTTIQSKIQYICIINSVLNWVRFALVREYPALIHFTPALLPSSSNVASCHPVYRHHPMAFRCHPCLSFNWYIPMYHLAVLCMSREPHR